MNFKISSRATILLGRESVAKVEGAIIELIKNTYDADATLCFITFDIQNDCIYILDNGVGMTEYTIENHWMMIGTDNKKENFKSEKNRIKSGEKGIGRFALDRLGSKCEMYTKNKESRFLIRWTTDWGNFENPGKTIDQIEAEVDYLDIDYLSVIPNAIYQNIMKLEVDKAKDIPNFKVNLETGTLFKISNLRDDWTEKEINNVLNTMGYLIPPAEQKDYIICLQKKIDEDYIEVENEISEEYDYKLQARFTGEEFIIYLDRNEFDLNKIPQDVFDMDGFKKEPYRYEDFLNRIITYKLTISQLMKNNDARLINEIKKIGEFTFSYIFMKLSLRDDSQETFFYKEISKNRRLWMENHSGIKIYRDNFLVRPYGDINSDSYDWLGLDSRRAHNPASISHSSGNWRVRNAQGQGTIKISRVNNECILDKSSREGIIENNYFRIFKEIIINIISIFEQDRAYIGRYMKIYSDIKDEKEKAKKDSQNISQKILSDRGKKAKSKFRINNEVKTLAKAVKYYEEEREELTTEIKSLRSLATNGLITTSIVHDLKGINAQLVNRVRHIQLALELKDEYLISRNLEDLRKNDTFLKAWITVITNQSKKDRRKRKKQNIYEIIEETITVLEPILTQKQIKVDIQHDGKQVFKRIFKTDFDSILYNLIINSIEAFEKIQVQERKINISMEANDELIVRYRDNGGGLDKIFKDPYDIFNFGTTSKYDKDGEQVGTGLGMYIVASTIREYNGHYSIAADYDQGFGLDLHLPI